jgi:NDP-sugar pyrophosphorylase family protein
MTEMLDMPALLLVGGMGTRLRSAVPSTPKPLASVGDQPFLEILVRQLSAQGVGRVVLCTGYLADQVEEKFGNGQRWGIEIEYSKELCPLGTAGAIKLAQSHLKNATSFLVMNGDSFLEIDLLELARFHRGHGGVATMAVVAVEDASRYGTVEMDARGRVTGLLEKAGSHCPGVVNGGVYLFNREVLDSIPEGPVSLEKDVFPRLLPQGVYAWEQRGMFIDIGTPEDYARARQLSPRLVEAALSQPPEGSPRAVETE